MVPMPVVHRRGLAYPVKGLIPREAIEFRAFTDELIVSGILKLLIGKSFHQWTAAG